MCAVLEMGMVLVVDEKEKNFYIKLRNILFLIL